MKSETLSIFGIIIYYSSIVYIAVCFCLFIGTFYWYFFQGIHEPIGIYNRLLIGLIRGHSSYIILAIMTMLGFICFIIGSKLKLKNKPLM